VDFRTLGASGLLVSEMGLGTNNFGTRLDEATTRAVIDQAIDSGITFFDTADVYGRGASETVIGKVLGARRRQVVITTKGGSAMGESPYERGASRRWILEAAEASLRRLDTDYIDLYLIHTPDSKTPLEETLRALDDLVRTGKVRYIGHSNHAAWQIADFDAIARSEHLARPIAAQHRYNLIHRDLENEVLPACRAHGVGIIPYTPLATGFLTGKYSEGRAPEGARLVGHRMAAELLTGPNFERLARLGAFAAERGHSLVELALGWLLSRPEIGSVIAGASSADQVRSNVASSGWRLTPAEMALVAAL